MQKGCVVKQLIEVLADMCGLYFNKTAGGGFSAKLEYGDPGEVEAALRLRFFTDTHVALRTRPGVAGQVEIYPLRPAAVASFWGDNPDGLAQVLANILGADLQTQEAAGA